MPQRRQHRLSPEGAGRPAWGWTVGVVGVVVDVIGLVLGLLGHHPAGSLLLVVGSLAVTGAVLVGRR